ncbi:glycoside hydrolase family 43 protein [Cohnella sp. GCM10027633]|uniref:glycoside hydrolase family 43 protein n=1 Tax=unclassified Cohnella TaxID=2636738 RepID=UPI00362E0216
MSVFNAASDVANPSKGHRLADIPAHDPFVLPDAREGVYYLYTSAVPRLTGTDGWGVLTYTSTDLELWEGPYVVFAVPDDGWAHPMHGAWAPEVHLYNGRYYLFVTLHNEGRSLPDTNAIPLPKHWRGTAIAASDSPLGPFELIGPDMPVTPSALMTLDGTLYVDEAGKPWMVYCHEWIQTVDGTIEAIPLKDDLSGAAGEPIHLFKASEATWDTGERTDGYEGKIHVTDGCQLYRTKGDRLVMLWSSYDKGKYVQTIARSASGRLEGPWEQLEPLVGGDSGHGMLFRTFEGDWLLILHRPFKMPESRCRVYRMEETEHSFRVVGPYVPSDGNLA